VDRDTGHALIGDIVCRAEGQEEVKNASGMQKGADDLEDLRLNLEIMEGL